VLLAHGASRRLIAMNGELPADLTEVESIKKMLMEPVGMKRQRSLSSANSLVLFSVLPDLAKQFYAAWSLGDVSAHVTSSLRAPDDPRAQLLAEQMAAHTQLVIDDLHVCTKTSKVVVELSSSATPTAASTPSTKAMHSLTFTEEGLVDSFVPYGLVEVTSAC